MKKNPVKEFSNKEKIEAVEDFPHKPDENKSEIESSIQESYEQLSPKDTEEKNDNN